MSSQAVANRYAQALFLAAEEKGNLEQANEELQTVKQIAETTAGFSSFLTHPKVTSEQKSAFIQTSFQEALSETTLNTLLLLIDRKRIDILIPMIDKYKELYYEAKNMAEATVYSAKPLTQAEEDQLAELFARKTGKAKLIVKNEVNANILGGLKIRIGDRIYDGSVKSQLDRMRRQLIAGTR